MPMRVAFILTLATFSGCAAPLEPIEFLTRDGCVQTEVMRVRLDEAIQGLLSPLAYSVVDIDALPATDARKGYPTPTILRGGIDLFGMAQPTPPHPKPT